MPPLNPPSSAPARGARAIISLKIPSVELGQYIMAQIWVQKGQYNGLESIQASWAVSDKMYICIS